MNWAEFKEAKIGDYRTVVLEHVDWVWEKGTSWAVVGPNGSGKSSLAAFLFDRWSLLAGQANVSAGFPKSLDAWIGFERQKILLENERKNDDSDLREIPDPGTLVRDFVPDDSALERFGLSHKKTRGLKHLSTGELRRACLARAVAAKLDVLILDEPYEGLDVNAVADLKTFVDEWLESGKDLLFLTRKSSDVPSRISHILTMEKGTTVSQSGPVVSSWAEISTKEKTRQLHFQTSVEPGEPVIEMTNVDAGYLDVSVLRNFRWKVRHGERWLVRGPNGSGKSTLLSLVGGEHPQVFSQDILLFGKRRGPDLTLSELKTKIAFLSYAVHQQFRNLFDVTALEVVVSGCHRTIGLYREPSWEEIESGKSTMETMGIETLKDTLWDELSWGSQRSVLLARALVGRPQLVMLDEPCQGLDEEHQDQFLFQVSKLIDETGATLIYVTHRVDEIDEKGFQILDLGKVVNGEPS